RMLTQARSMPMSASVMVNKTEATELLDRLEGALDQTLRQAREVVSGRDAMVAEGRDEADEIRRRAESERERLVSDTEVYKLAQERAEEARATTKRECEEL